MSAELEIYEEEQHVVPTNLFGAAEPEEVIAKASSVASALADVIRRQKLASNIKGREHVRVEGWTLLGSMLGVFPVVVWSRKCENGWEARVEARTRDGAVVGAAEAQCTRDENMWSFEPKGRDGKKLEARDDYALRSMAQTRAVSKALRAPLGFVMTLAGFDATPAEEMPRENKAQKSKIEKMRARIIELSADDEQQIRDIVQAYFGTPLDDLDEHELTIVGQDLRLWIDNARQGDFGITPF